MSTTNARGVAPLPQPRALRRSARRTCVRPSAARATPDSASFTAAPSADAATVKDRAKAGLLGAVLADVATMPLHWHYDKCVPRA